ncbi:MAG: rhodanese-like domain-containing protein [Candidatus Thermoplasmatota archaeon]|nr:rhodanese-like domain-containing protein [Candidatus Thermoplasmatota archaeon]MBU1941509.1 rhodanese-like domain-containing protein [Candidatus Thermoplasmatota archaeon]
MKNKIIWKSIVLNIVLIVVSSTAISAALNTPSENDQTEVINEFDTDNTQPTNGYINLTVCEVWDLIQDPSNGIQYLIDVRTPMEYITERLFTPSVREKPRLFPLQFMQLEGIFLRFFMMVYTGKEIILYCRSANRSFIATKLLIDHGFSGVIYNMVGGINEWKLASLPTVKGRVIPL